MEVIALLAKHDLGRFLEAAFNGRSEDHAHSQDTRPIQRQHRLSQEEILNLVKQYEAGSTVNRLAHTFGVHRTTVLAHLDRCGIKRRRTLRRLTDPEVETAASLYRDGNSLKTTASYFAIDAETLRREFKKAGVAIRARKGEPIPEVP